MTRAYGIENEVGNERSITFEYNDLFVTNYWSDKFIIEKNFEEKEHYLEACDDYYVLGRADDCPDISVLRNGFLVFSVDTWRNFEKSLQPYCRIAEKVRTNEGSKRFIIVHPFCLLDILDIEASDAVWNDGLVSAVTKEKFFRQSKPLPPLFMVKYKSKVKYRGSDFRVSGKMYAASSFVDKYNQMNCSGLRFNVVPFT